MTNFGTAHPAPGRLKKYAVRAYGACIKHRMHPLARRVEQRNKFALTVSTCVACHASFRLANYVVELTI